MEHKTCPQCGAAITEEKCPYCGTLFYDFACIDLKEPFWIKIKDGNIIRRLKVYLQGAQYTIGSPDTSLCYCDNEPVYMMSSPATHELNMCFSVLPDDGILAKIVDTDVIDKDTKAW